MFTMSVFDFIAVAATVPVTANCTGCTTRRDCIQEQFRTTQIMRVMREIVFVSIAVHFPSDLLQPFGYEKQYMLVVSS